jgi:hypothetical protein
MRLPRDISKICLITSSSQGQTHLPAAKVVPLADPKVDIVTDRGISQAITPRMRLPKVCGQRWATLCIFVLIPPPTPDVFLLEDQCKFCSRFLYTFLIFLNLQVIKNKSNTSRIFYLLYSVALLSDYMFRPLLNSAIIRSWNSLSRKLYNI